MYVGLILKSLAIAAFLFQRKQFKTKISTITMFQKKLFIMLKVTISKFFIVYIVSWILGVDVFVN